MIWRRGFWKNWVLTDPRLAASIHGIESPSGKNILKSKTFKDGNIYLFVRGDYVKPTWMCRIKAPGMPGYVYKSTRTTDEHQAYKFADDL